jgi:formate-dependent nitrite reductase cytochrome c552 subunit
MADLRDAGYLGTREEIQAELDDIAAACRQFHVQQPDQVMKQVAAYGARLTELTVLLHRVEALDRQYTRVRTQQVEKWLAELDRQFKVASRLVEVQRQDLALLGGA